MYRTIGAILVFSIALIILPKITDAASPSAAIVLPPQNAGHSVNSGIKNSQPRSPFHSHVNVTFSATAMSVQSDSLPQHEYGPFPGPGNPNSARAQNLRFEIPRQPRLAASLVQLPTGPIGIAINGVPFFNSSNAQQQNTVQGPYAATFDNCDGRPDPLGIYHYQRIPDCLVRDAPGQHSVAYGYAFDGFPIYGPQDANGLPPTDLDECNGHRDNIRGYHYHMTRDFPYIIGCYKGVPTLPKPQGLPPAMQANVASPAYNSNSAISRRTAQPQPQQTVPPLANPTQQQTTTPVQPIARKSPFFANVNVSYTDHEMIIQSDGLPDHYYGPFDSPGYRVSAQNLRFAIPRQPSIAATTTAIPFGPIGIAINGALFFSPYTESGQDAVKGPYAEQFDACDGHPDQHGIYHYHRTPYCLLKDRIGQHSMLYGYAFDGFPIYGPLGLRGLPPQDLDECNGHKDDVRGYHYHMTRDFPYIIGCYKGTPNLEHNSNGGLPTSAISPSMPPADGRMTTASNINASGTTVSAAQSQPTHSSTQHLVNSFSGSAQARGELLILFGQVVDVNGNPVPNAAVEIWQTDANGIYDHPSDPRTVRRNHRFQFYGTSQTDSAGWYAFRTIIPGRYESRPRHIHFKVKQSGTTLLTSQFYFTNDVAQVQGERMFRRFNISSDPLLLQLVQGDNALLANGRIVVDTGISAGSLIRTPSQAEGPYYPVASVASYDNDLVR